MSFLIHVSFHVERRGLPSPAALRGWAEAALRAAQRRRGELSIVLVDADEGRALNLRGVNARVVGAGTIRVGDQVRKQSS